MLSCKGNLNLLVCIVIVLNCARLISTYYNVFFLTVCNHDVGCRLGTAASAGVVSCSSRQLPSLETTTITSCLYSINIKLFFTSTLLEDILKDILYQFAITLFLKILGQYIVYYGDGYSILLQCLIIGTTQVVGIYQNIKNGVLGCLVHEKHYQAP